MATIVPIRGEHQSAQSLLAELATTPGIRGVAVVTFDDDKNVGYAYFETSADELALASIILSDRALKESST